MNRNYGRGHTTGALEGIRAHFGSERMKSYFKTIAARSSRQAAVLVNDRGLMFYSLYQLLPELQAQGLVPQLNARNLTAIRVSANALQSTRLLEAIREVPEADDETRHNVLKWMLKTGAADDGAEDSFDHVLDTAASLLANRYKDTKMLPIMADMLFKRNQKGLLIHDIAWAYFASRDPAALRLAAGYLRSSREKDYLFACHLLSLPPAPAQERTAVQQKQYTDYMQWLNENYDYLYYTGESFQLTSNPKPFLINPAAKYIGKPVVPAGNTPVTPFSAEDSLLLEGIKNIPSQDLAVLADYSARLREQNNSRWRAFINRPVSQQLVAAREAAGGAQ